MSEMLWQNSDWLKLSLSVCDMRRLEPSFSALRVNIDTFHRPAPGFIYIKGSRVCYLVALKPWFGGISAEQISQLLDSSKGCGLRGVCLIWAPLFVGESKKSRTGKRPWFAAHHTVSRYTIMHWGWRILTWNQSRHFQSTSQNQSANVISCNAGWKTQDFYDTGAMHWGDLLIYVMIIFISLHGDEEIMTNQATYLWILISKTY